MWCCHFPIYICDIKFLNWLRYWSYFRHSNKSGCCSLYIQFHKLLWLWFSVNFLLNLGFFCIAVELGGQTTAHGPHAARQSIFSGPSTLIETSIYIMQYDIARSYCEILSYCIVDSYCKILSTGPRPTLEWSMRPYG